MVIDEFQKKRSHKAMIKMMAHTKTAFAAVQTPAKSLLYWTRNSTDDDKLSAKNWNTKKMREWGVTDSGYLSLRILYDQKWWIDHWWRARFHDDSTKGEMRNHPEDIISNRSSIVWAKERTFGWLAVDETLPLRLSNTMNRCCSTTFDSVVVLVCDTAFTRIPFSL